MPRRCDVPVPMGASSHGGVTVPPLPAPPPSYVKRISTACWPARVIWSRVDDRAHWTQYAPRALERLWRRPPVVEGVAPLRVDHVVPLGTFFIRRIASLARESSAQLSRTLATGADGRASDSPALRRRSRDFAARVGRSIVLALPSASVSSSVRVLNQGASPM